MPIELPIYARSSKQLLDPYALAKPTTSWGGIVGYILGIFLVIMVILVIINYTITPIFRLYPGGPGYIPVPGGDTSQIYWKTTKDTAPMMDASSSVVGIASQWSFAIDIDIKNPMHVSPSPRVLFHRGPSSSTIVPSGSSSTGTLLSTPTTLKGLLGNYNVAIALLPDTTDLVVSVLNSSSGMENVILQNVPIQTPFRVGVILSDTAMEVYLNGLLQRTRTYESGTTPFNATGMFFPPQGMNAETAQVANLHVWNSVISANQMRYASPALMTVKSGAKSDIPSSSCSSDIPKGADSKLTSWSNTFQTNLGSMSSSIQTSVNSSSATPTPSLSAVSTP